jgi:predicted  nucleic acid-binding Zn-ribbon protein
LLIKEKRMKIPKEISEKIRTIEEIVSCEYSFEL